MINFDQLVGLGCLIKPGLIKPGLIIATGLIRPRRPPGQPKADRHLVRDHDASAALGRVLWSPCRPARPVSSMEKACSCTAIASALSTSATRWREALALPAKLRVSRVVCGALGHVAGVRNGPDEHTWRPPQRHMMTRQAAAWSLSPASTVSLLQLHSDHAAEAGEGQHHGPGHVSSQRARNGLVARVRPRLEAVPVGPPWPSVPGPQLLSAQVRRHPAGGVSQQTSKLQTPSIDENSGRVQ
jgi:hypothetical protein